MQEWVTPKKGWILRSTQDGLEFVAAERNISLKFPNPEEHRERTTSILSGLQTIPQNLEDEGIREMIQSLEAQSVLQYQEHRPINLRSTSNVEQLIWKLRSAFVGSRGPIRIVYHLDPSQSSFFPFSSHVVATKYVPNGESGEEWTGGIDEDPVIAELKAIMEALERWASGVIPKTELLECSATKLGNTLDPRKAVAYAREQYRRKHFPLTPFSIEQKYWWKSVITFPRRQIRYLPVECLYYPIDSGLVSTPYTLANSSGVAAAFSFEEAVIRGVYEAIERDAFMLTWFNRLNMPKIQLETLPKKEQLRIRKMEELGYKLYLVNLTLDLAPVVLAIAVHNARRPALVLGAASNFNFLVAVSKAIGEVEYQLYWALRHLSHVHTLKDSKEVRGVLDHMALYASHKHLAKAKFLWEGPEIPCPEISPIDSEYELEELSKILESTGEELVLVDLTPPSLKELGVWVVRSIPLGLIPISFGYGMEPLGMPRLEMMPTDKCNPWPRNQPFTHPFA